MLESTSCHTSGASRASHLMAVAILAASAFSSNGGPVYADEDVQQRQAPLVFSFDIFDDQTVDAVWGSEVDVITYDHDQLEAAEILLPPFLAAKVNDAIAGGKGLEATGGLLEIIVFVGGTASGTRCHYYEPGRKHCHSTQ